jgi:uncharacterized protein with FMN-binding domain
MRRIALWFSSTVAALVLLFGYHTSTSGVAVIATTTQQPISGALTTPATSSNTESSTSTGSDTETSSGTESYSDGTATSGSQTVTGSVIQTQWGPVQVQITTGGSQITAVDIVQYPSGNGRDVEINNNALPVLVDETLAAQSADIDMVSGATVTSDGYIGSLQSALDEAGL